MEHALAGGRLTGVLDWTNASWGEPAMDLAHWRANLGTCYGVAVADRVIEAYAGAGGRAIDQTWRDVRILLDFIGDEDWSPPHSLEVAEALPRGVAPARLTNPRYAPRRMDERAGRTRSSRAG